MDIQHKVTLYVPNTRNISEILSETEHAAEVESALLFLSKTFGGATALPAQGAWFDDDGSYVREKVTLVYSYTESLNDDKRNAVTAYALKVKTELNQRAVTVEIDDKLYFI